MNRILVLPQRLARQLDLDVDHAIISIRDPGDDFKFPVRWGQRGLLPLYFRDLEKFRDAEEVVSMKGMTPDQASQVWEFCHQNRDVDTLVIHCWAGKSRSVGMAQAIGKIRGIPVEIHTSEPTPNQHVYQTMIETAW